MVLFPVPDDMVNKGRKDQYDNKAIKIEDLEAFKPPTPLSCKYLEIRCNLNVELAIPRAGASTSRGPLTADVVGCCEVANGAGD